MNKLKAFCPNNSYAPLLGLTTQYLTPIKSLVTSSEVLLHKNIISQYQLFYEEACCHGFNPWIVSSFRSFARQLKIWNEKCEGIRPIYNDTGMIMDVKRLSGEEQLFHILRFTALPGTSRHHWGTDFDIVDFNAMPSPLYQIKLTQDEFVGTGPFALFHQFIDEFMATKHNFLRRPYGETATFLEVASERWHLSATSQAKQFEKLLTFDFFCAFLDQLDHETIKLYHVIQDNKKTIYDNYIARYFI